MCTELLLISLTFMLSLFCFTFSGKGSSQVNKYRTQVTEEVSWLGYQFEMWFANYSHQPAFSWFKSSNRPWTSKEKGSSEDCK